VENKRNRKSQKEIGKREGLIGKKNKKIEIRVPAWCAVVPAGQPPPEPHLPLAENWVHDEHSSRSLD